VIERYYDRWGWIYPPLWGETIHWGLFKSGHESLGEATRQWTERTINLLQPTEGQRILDIGCGPAVTTHRLIERYGTFVDAIDISKFQLDRARASNSNHVLDGHLELIKGDVAEATLPLSKYDRAFSEAVFFHLSQKDKCLENIRAALRPNARFVFDDFLLVKSVETKSLSTAFRRFGNLRFYTESQFYKVLQRVGFKIVDEVSATEDVTRTYLKLLGNLEEVQLVSDCAFPESLYVILRTSFRAIVGLLRHGRLASKLSVVVAI